MVTTESHVQEKTPYDEGEDIVVYPEKFRDMVVGKNHLRKIVEIEYKDVKLQAPTLDRLNDPDPQKETRNLETLYTILRDAYVDYGSSELKVFLRKHEEAAESIIAPEKIAGFLDRVWRLTRTAEKARQ